jgi:hypothetical protein
MQIDPENHIVQRCVAGIQAEMAGRPHEALAAYTSAWEAATDPYERSIAAHYMARTGTTAEDRHRWNAVALAEAEQVSEPARVAAFLPSLHLNAGHSCEEIGRTDAAREHYRLGRAGLDELDAGPYTAVVRGGLDAAAERVGDEPPP